MTPFKLHPDFYNRPIRLTEEEKANPLEVLRIFFVETNLSEIRSELWQVVATCASVQDSVFDDPIKRQNLLILYREVERALEAALLLSEQWSGCFKNISKSMTK